MIKLPVSTSERLQCTVETSTDPTLFTIEFAFPTANVDPSSYTAGAWDSAAVQIGAKWQRVALTPKIGSGGVVLSAGKYDIYARVNGGGEAPVWRFEDTLVMV